MCHMKLQLVMHAEHSFHLSPPAPAASADAADPSSLTETGSLASGSHLGCISSELLPHIVRLAAPYTPQHMDLPLSLSPDIMPTCLGEDPGVIVPAVAEEAQEEWQLAPGQQQQ